MRPKHAGNWTSSVDDLTLYRFTATASAALCAVASWRATDAYEPAPYLLAMLVMAVVAVGSLRAIATHDEWSGVLEREAVGRALEENTDG